MTISASTTLQAIAYELGMADSAVDHRVYSIACATPTFSLPSGSYSSTQTASISTTTIGATIRYTTDGTTPSETNGLIYSGPLTISATTILQAIAYLPGLLDSSVSSRNYIIK